MSHPAPRDLAVVGATATGKTALALEINRRVGGFELVSVDAMAVYRGLDIGTEKPRGAERWHLVDLADASTDYSVSDFQAAARDALAAIHGRGSAALLVGGTGLYHRAVIDELALPGRFPEAAAALERELAVGDGAALASLYSRLQRLDPVAAERIEPGNARRIVRALEVTLGSGRPFSSFGPGLASYRASEVAMAGLALERRELDRRLEERLEGQLAAGFVEEVASLAASPGGLSRTARQAIGYRELLSVVEEGTPLADAKAAIIRRLKAFARRQEAWFRRDPRVTWFPADDPALAERVVEWWHLVASTPCETGPS